MGRNGNTGQIAQFGVTVNIKSIGKQSIDTTRSVLTRRQADVVYHKQGNLRSSRSPITIGRGQPTYTMQPLITSFFSLSENLVILPRSLSPGNYRMFCTSKTLPPAKYLGDSSDYRPSVA